MPKFKVVSMDEAVAKTGRKKSSQHLRQYTGYLEQVSGDQAGVLQPSAGETAAAVRRRLGSAARVAGKDLVIRRVGEDVYFWEPPRKGGRRRRRTTK